MKNEISTDITDSDIDNLFNNNDSSFLNSKSEEKVQDIIPQELSISNKKSTTYVDRPVDNNSEKTKIRKKHENINNDIVSKINYNISDLKELTSLSQVKLYIKKLQDIKYTEQQKNNNTKQILAGLTDINVDKGTDCTFHIYQPKDILGNQIHCYCKFCSAYKMFTNDEWTDYCIKYRKWL